MADTPVDVYLARPSGDCLVGRLYAHRRRGTQSATFSYAEQWLARADAFELEPALPLVAGQQQTPVGLALFGAFADCSPDRWGQQLILRSERRQAERDGRTPSTLGEIDFLLRVRDDVRQGALRFADPGTRHYRSDGASGVPHLIDLGRLLEASDRLEREVADDDDLRALLHAGSSLGGARPKAHVVDAHGRLAIAKLPSPTSDRWNVTAWERVALDLAARSGISVPASRLHQIGNHTTLIVDRFDRDGATRIPYASALTMIEGRDGERYSYLDVVEAVETISARPVDDLRELWRRIAFSIMVSNTDDHLRNQGFLRDDAEAGWRLSPAFDINPDPIGAGTLATSITELDDAADVDLLLDVADWFRLDAEQARNVLGEVERASGAWRTAATGIGLDEAEIEIMAPAFEHPQRARACALTR